MASREYIHLFTAGDKVWIRSTGPSLYSSTSYETSWSMFSLENITNENHAFMMGRSSGWVGSESRLPFDLTLLNPNGLWTSSEEFNAPNSGIYMFIFSVGYKAISPTRIDLKMDNFVINFYRNYNRGSTDIAGRSALANLEQDKKVRVDASDGGKSDAATLATSIGGFHYVPLKFTPVAWFVTRSTDPGLLSVDISLTFDYYIVLQNIGSGWGPSMTTAVCPQSGLYFVYVSSGVQAGQMLKVSIIQDLLFL